MEKNWICLVCGASVTGADKPAACPVCGAGAAALRTAEPAADTPESAHTGAPQGADTVWVCSVCSWKGVGETPPERCPICGAGAGAFAPEAQPEAKEPEAEPALAAGALEPPQPVSRADVMARASVSARNLFFIG